MVENDALQRAIDDYSQQTSLLLSRGCCRCLVRPRNLIVPIHKTSNYMRLLLLGELCMDSLTTIRDRFEKLRPISIPRGVVVERRKDK
jgi:hypothetical protein